MYRIRPAVCHEPFKPYQLPKAIPNCVHDCQVNTPNQLRWSPFELPTEPVDFIDGLALLAYAGDPSSRHGLSIYIYGANRPMDRRAFYNSDGDMLIVPQQGTLRIITEFGILLVEPNEICVIPRCVRFRVVPEIGGGESLRGYILEVFNGRFELPDLGPIGANGLANPQDFCYPTACYEDDQGEWQLLTKYLNAFYVATQDHSPFDVVAWRGNYVPFKYDLSLFNPVNTVSHDHLVDHLSKASFAIL